MKVLIVDREAFLAELVKLALEADGHAGFAVSGLDEASEVLRSVRIDLITLDLAADSKKPLRWLEETILAHGELHGRVFVLTDRTLKLDEAESLLACGARVIQKPFTLHQMRETVRTIGPPVVRPSDPPPRGPVIEA
jgi:DNA-binding response OmpR family regulator